jgi:hypothetical protein
MKRTSHSGGCIACGSKKVQMVTVMFMAERHEYPVCDACAPFVERVNSDQSLGADFIRFLGVSKLEHSHQSGGAFSCVVPRGTAPEDLQARMSDFGVYCEFLGERIRALRSHEPAA